MALATSGATLFFGLRRRVVFLFMFHEGRVDRAKQTAKATEAAETAARSSVANGGTASASAAGGRFSPELEMTARSRTSFPFTQSAPRCFLTDEQDDVRSVTLKPPSPQ